MNGLDYLRWLPHRYPENYKIIIAISQGLSYKEVGKIFNLPEKSVSQRLKRIYRKVDARNSTHLVQLAHEAGIL